MGVPLKRDIVQIDVKVDAEVDVTIKRTTDLTLERVSIIK